MKCNGTTLLLLTIFRDDLASKKDWPPLENVRKYREEVFKLIDDFIATRSKLQDNVEIG
jgi:hypothetical protein